MIEEIEDAKTPVEPEAAVVELDHTLLRIWKEQLGNIELEEMTPINIRQAQDICRMFPQLKVQELPEYARKFYALLRDIRFVVIGEIDSDPEALKHVDDDATANLHHYASVIANWIRLVNSWNQEWDCSADDAHISQAAIERASAFVLGSNGIAQYVDNIGITIDDDFNQLIEDAAQ